MRLGAVIFFALTLACVSVARAQSPDQQRAARERMFGMGEDVRWRAENVAELFASEGWQLRVRGATVQNRGLQDASLPVWAPLASGPCRVFFYSPIPARPGGAAAWLCRLDQPVAFFQFSFEQRPNEHAPLVSELTRVDETALGVQVAECRDVEPIGGVERQSWCESTFTHGAQTDSGSLIVVIGSTPQFFFKATTACAGAQCEPARRALTTFLNEIRVGAAP
ncbi:MAG: hypothetical protein ACREH4_09780 [Vitreimonas sp.]